MTLVLLFLRGIKAALFRRWKNICHRRPIRAKVLGSGSERADNLAAEPNKSGTPPRFRSSRRTRSRQEIRGVEKAGHHPLFPNLVIFIAVMDTLENTLLRAITMNSPLGT